MSGKPVGSAGSRNTTGSALATANPLSSAASTKSSSGPETGVRARGKRTGRSATPFPIRLLASGQPSGLMLEDEAVEDGLGDLAGLGIELSDRFELKSQVVGWSSILRVE